jgi:hypothetical protein
LKYARPFLLPYYRPAQYTGDQIGLRITGDLTASLQVIVRMLAGKNIAPSIGVRGLIEQADDVRHRALHRLTQLTTERPHLVNRYLNLLAFAKTAVPEQFQRFRDELDDTTRRRLDALLPL